MQIVSPRFYSQKPTWLCWDFSEAKVWSFAHIQSTGSYLNLKWLKKSKKGGSRWQRIGQWQVKHAGSSGGLTGCLHHNMAAGKGQAAPSRLPRPLRRGPMPLLRHPFPLNINKLLRKKVYSLGGDGGCPETPVEAHGVSRWFVDKGAMLPPPCRNMASWGTCSDFPPAQEPAPGAAGRHGVVCSADGAEGPTAIASEPQSCHPHLVPHSFRETARAGGDCGEWVVGHPAAGSP